jgi:hypothetical protein
MNDQQTSMVFLLVCLIMLIISCAQSNLKQYIHPETDISEFSKIAVLPLENLTSNKFADEKIGSLLIIDFLSRGIDVIEPGEVMTALREMKAIALNTIPVTDIQKIGKRINADAVVIGSVGTFAINKGISVSYPEVSLYLIMIDIRSGNIAWSAWHTSGGPSFWTRHFGAEGATLDEISKKVIKDTVATLF